MEIVNEFAQASKLFNENILFFQSSSQIYKSFLDKNLRKRFCVGEHCKTVFMIEVKIRDKWGSTPKIFYTKAEAEKELARLEDEYLFLPIFEFRIVTRKEKDLP